MKRKTNKEIIEFDIHKPDLVFKHNEEEPRGIIFYGTEVAYEESTNRIIFEKNKISIKAENIMMNDTNILEDLTKIKKSIHEIQMDLQSLRENAYQKKTKKSRLK